MTPETPSRTPSPGKPGADRRPHRQLKWCQFRVAKLRDSLQIAAACALKRRVSDGNPRRPRSGEAALFGRWSLTRSTRLPSISAVCCCIIGSLFAPGIALANDSCHESNGVYTCEGNQSAGVQNGHNDLGTNADDVLVENLSQDIGPNLN